MKAVLCNLTACRNINSITAVFSLTYLEASPPHRSHKILADRCCDAFQKAGCSDRYLRRARCALLSSVLPAVQSCYGCYSLGGLLQGSWHKDDLTSGVLVRLCECVCVCVCLVAERHGKGLSRNVAKRCLRLPRILTNYHTTKLYTHHNKKKKCYHAISKLFTYDS